MPLRSLLLVLLCASFSAVAKAFESYQWVVLATVAEPIAIGNPYPCTEVEFTGDCTNVFFDVPFRIKEMLGSRFHGALDVQAASGLRTREACC